MPVDLRERRKQELEALERVFALIPKSKLKDNINHMERVEIGLRNGQQALELLRGFRQFILDNDGDMQQWREMVDKLLGPPPVEEEENEETETSAEPVGA